MSMPQEQGAAARLCGKPGPPAPATPETPLSSPVLRVYKAADVPLEHDPQKWNPLLRQGHAQVFELAHVLIDQAIPPDRNML
jgi:hypothetical protein